MISYQRHAIKKLKEWSHVNDLGLSQTGEMSFSVESDFFDMNIEVTDFVTKTDFDNGLQEISGKVNFDISTPATYYQDAVSMSGALEASFIQTPESMFITIHDAEVYGLEDASSTHTSGELSMALNLITHEVIGKTVRIPVH